MIRVGPLQGGRPSGSNSSRPSQCRPGTFPRDWLATSPAHNRVIGTRPSNEEPDAAARRVGSADVVDVVAYDLWVPGPEVPQVHPGLFPFVLDYPEHAEPGLGQGRQRLVVASGCQEREIRPCSSPMTAPRDAPVPMRLRISSNARCRAVGLSWQPARVTAYGAGCRCQGRQIRCSGAAWSIGGWSLTDLPRSPGGACPGVFEGKDLGCAVLPGDIRDAQCVAHPLARNPAVHLGDIVEDRAVQVRPSHAEDVDQHRPPVGGSEDVASPRSHLPTKVSICGIPHRSSVLPGVLPGTPHRVPWPATARRTA
jgi:hypothetical protein